MAESGERLRCPICGKPSAEESPRPFCSERCKLIDLGRWLDGAYQIPSDDDDLDESEIKPIEPESQD